MISSTFLRKLADSFLLKKSQTDSFRKAISSFSLEKSSSKMFFQKLLSSAIFAKLPSKSPYLSSRDSYKLNTTIRNTKDYYVVDNKVFDNFEKDNNTEVFVIHLNRPFDIKTLQSLHNVSLYTIMADGAANRFYDDLLGIPNSYSIPLIHDSKPFSTSIVPHALVGDFDSIRKEVLVYYQKQGVKTFHDHSQDSSDLEKCLKHLIKKIIDEKLNTENKSCKLIITGGFGGRIDHTLNNIHLIHKFAEICMKQYNMSLYLMDENSIGTCILPGKTKYVRSKNFEYTAGCGIFSLVGQQAKVKTKGLKWNLGPESPNLSFKNFVSSSNEMVDEIIEFETDTLVFWATTNKIQKDQLSTNTRY